MAAMSVGVGEDEVERDEEDEATRKGSLFLPFPFAFGLLLSGDANLFTLVLASAGSLPIGRLSSPFCCVLEASSAWCTALSLSMSVSRLCDVLKPYFFSSFCSFATVHFSKAYVGSMPCALPVCFVRGDMTVDAFRDCEEAADAAFGGICANQIRLVRLLAADLVQIWNRSRSMSEYKAG